MPSRDEQFRDLRSYPRGNLESPFLEGELFLGEAEAEWEARLATSGAESPFQRTFEEKPTAAVEPESHEDDKNFDAEEEPFAVEAEEEGESSEVGEDEESEPATEQEGVSTGPRSIRVEAGRNVPVTGGEYAFHQGNVTEGGKLDEKGRAYFSKIDPSKPFLFEVRDRVCAIRVGAFFNPDDARIEYGGTAFDWTLVRDDKNAEKTFWPHYQREMDTSRKNVNPHTVEKFLQHEHITRRPIRVATPFLSQLSKVTIQATPPKIRVGPFVRYTDHERAVIWLETVTPNMVRVRYKKAGGGTESSRYASTVRVGGRHFAAVEIDGLEEDRFYDYTVELAPLPATRSIPIEQGDFQDVFPMLTSKVAESMKYQLAVASLHKTEWLTFRTLLPKYNKLRFATGSCRWYPGDKKGEKDKKALGPDMFDGLGNWLLANPKEKWPHFLFFSGDQIYSDEIGDNHGLMLTYGRFAERIPGPVDPAGSVRDMLIDGAWAGRFAHRYKPFKYPGENFVKTVRISLQKLDDIYARYPDIKGIYREYPEANPREKLKWRHRTLKNRRENTGATGEAADEKKAREAVALLPVVDNLEISVEPFRAFLPHWNAGFSLAYRGNPMGLRYLSHNFLLWSIPDFEHLLPTIADRDGQTVVRKPDSHGHPSAEEGKHAADFAEYAYLYERSWTSSRNVRVLLAQVPTFLMFDDHELTDDWNFDVSWVRMLHNEQDAFGMWPKTLTDGLAAYWVYQGWCNKAPSKWKSHDPRVKALHDPRVKALADAQRAGTDALPALRKCIHDACFTPAPSKSPKAAYQSGLSLEWHYKLPFDPPFLVPDCRSRKRLVPADDKLRIIDHDDPSKTPMSQTIDDDQLAWMRRILVDQWRGGPVAFIALSTPLLLQKKVMAFMRIPEVAARAWAQGVDLASLGAALFDSPKLGTGSDELIHVFRRAKDLEHMIRDKSWRDLWELAEAMRMKGSPVKSLVLVSGDVHHSYSMTANLPGKGRPRPEFVQVTSSGLQTTIRKEFKTSVAEKLGSRAFDVGKYRLVPGFVRKNDTGPPDLALYENTVALVDVNIGSEVDMVVTYIAGQDKHLFRYTSGAAYMVGGEPAVSRQLAQPELETFEGFDDAEFGDEKIGNDEFENDAESSYPDIDPELAEEVEHPDHESEDDEPSFETLVPKVSLADLRTRIDEYFNLAKASYKLPDGTAVSARPQFRYAKAGGVQAAIERVSGILGKAFEKSHPKAIYMAAYGRAKPSDIAAITQALIDAGEFPAVSAAHPGVDNEQLVRALQREFKMGIDCAGYVQLAFVHAFTGSDDDSPSVRSSLGLHERRGWERLAALSSSHFTKMNVVDAQTGDLFVMKPRAGSSDRSWHTVIIVDHTDSGTVHTFLVDASWGTDLYGVAAGGVARRELKHDTSTGEWWDVNPVSGLDDHKNLTGPYNGHPIHGMFRAKRKK